MEMRKLRKLQMIDELADVQLEKGLSLKEAL